MTCQLGNSNFKACDVLFVNGIWNSQSDANQSRKEISRLLGRPVELIYNRSFTLMRFLEIVTRAITCGLISWYGIGHLVGKQYKTVKTVATSAIALASIQYDLRKVQAMKEKVAGDLIQRVEEIFATRAPSSHCVTIICHSQGADIVDMALRGLDKSLSNRISVINYGGKKPISKGLAGVVRNVEHVQDIVPRLASGVHSDVTHVPLRAPTPFPSSLSSHTLSSYLNQTPDFLRRHSRMRIPPPLPR